MFDQPLLLPIVVSFLFNVVFAGALVWLSRQNRQLREDERTRHQQERDKLKQDLKDRRQQIKEWKTEAKDLLSLQDKALDEVVRLTAFFARTETYFKEKQRNEWLALRQSIDYSGREDVNARFVHPLLLFLRYSDGQLSHNLFISWTPNSGVPQDLVVDWTIYKSTARQKDQVCFFVYTVDPKRPIRIDDVEEAAHKAVGLQSSLGVVTNGVQLQIYRLEVTQRDLLFDFPVADLTFRWQEIEGILGLDKLVGSPIP